MVINMKKVVMFANGDYQNEYKYNKDDYIIAIDGGYEHLIKRGIKPNLIVGDLDSITSPIEAGSEVIKLSPVKDDTDTLYALKEARRRGFDYFELYGMLGKALNHTLGNIQLFLYLKKEGISFKAFYQNEVYQVLHDEKISLEKEGRFSLLSLTEESVVTLKDVAYEVNNLRFTNDFPLGIDNEFLPNKKAQLQVDSGYMLIIYPKN